MSFGGKFDYAKEYAKYKPNQPDSIFEQYVEDTPDLLNAWNQIQDDPSGTQGSYWKPRGATSKAAFGRAHAAEDFALSEGTYHGGTDVDPYSDPTRFESFMDTLSTTPATGEEEPARPGFNPYLGDNPSFPLLDTAYTSPSAPSWAQGGGGLIPDAYAPWASSSMQTSKGGYVPQSIWEGEGPVQGLGYGVTHTAPATGLINIPAEESSTGGANTTTDTSGNKWVMSPGGQWYRADSDYGEGLLGNSRLFYDQHYDSSGNYVGAEGQSVFATMQHQFNPQTGKFEMMNVPGSGAVSINKHLDPTSALAKSGFFDSAIGVNPNMTQQEYASAHAAVVDAINSKAGKQP